MKPNLLLLFIPFFTLAIPAMSNPSPQPLNVGDPAPHIESVNHKGEAYSFAEAYNNPWVLVYFYPKADTPGCTSQACSLRDAYEKLTDSGVTVIGVSMDSVEDQAAFAEKYDLPFTLIADASGEVVRAFGVPTLQRGSASFASRQAFLISKGTIVWRDLSASTDKQAEDVLAVLSTTGPS